MNCRDYQAKIDEQVAGADDVARHLENCAACRLFQSERQRLFEFINKLERRTAPTNFDFKLRARLHTAQPAAIGGAQIWRRRFVFASPALAAAAVSVFVLSNSTLFAPQVTQNPETPVVSQSSVAPLTVLNEPINAANLNVQSSVIANDFENNRAAQVTPKLLRREKQIVAAQASLTKSARTAAPPPPRRKTPILVNDIDEPIRNSPLLSSAGATQVYAPGVDPSKTQKIAAAEALKFFGVEITSADGRVESVKTNSQAAQKGIAAGDVIETVNGEKVVGADLENLLQQVELGVARGNERRKVVLTLKTDLPR